MASFEIIPGDIVGVTIAGIKALLVVEAIRSAGIVRLPSGKTVADTSRFLPDISPNAVNRIMLCGPVAPQGDVGPTPAQLQAMRFEAPQVCVFLEDVKQHFPKARDPKPAGGVQRN